ncbi:acyl carrier protein, mitochondrial-like [Sycon ciliatum]|uniref:acyl carrier protein, mitochondrial-like n=1 Tax=Sycon ciliatum TaxID=27933 RepID=UPI0031F5F684|eukprot:scpid95170/ scgid33499/ Acyl carrier protein, mitochondrial; CI-SDAP; NADH-ubiquinone oxidoreductase 9.6 kDa subunit
MAMTGALCRSLLLRSALASRCSTSSSTSPSSRTLSCGRQPPTATAAAPASVWNGRTAYGRQNRPCRHQLLGGSAPAMPGSGSGASTNIATRSYFIQAGSKSFGRADYEFHAILLLKTFDKVDPEKVTLDAHFKKDLGLDSLDHVEVIMVFEDHFHMSIEDHEAEHMFTLRQLVDYMMIFDEVDKPQYIYPHHKAADTPEI